MAGNSGAVVVPWQAHHRAFDTARPAVPSSGQKKPALSLTWQGANMPRVQAGNYRAVCTRWQGPEYVREFHRWSLRLEFSLLDDGTLVSAFFNFGNQSGPQMPKQRSRYYRAWTLANGMQPRKGQELKFETFVDPELIYTVRVEDSATDGKGEAKPDALIYSRVAEILKVERGIS